MPICSIGTAWTSADEFKTVAIIVDVSFLHMLVVVIVVSI